MFSSNPVDDVMSY